jgi:hypothetical protein
MLAKLPLKYFNNGIMEHSELSDGRTPMNEGIRSMLELGITETIIRQLVLQHDTKNAYRLIEYYTALQDDNRPKDEIDDLVIGFVKNINEKIYEDALFVQFVTGAASNIKI